MSTKHYWVAITCLTLGIFADNVCAETVGFPKDKPAITLELPAGSTVKYGDRGSLWILFKDKQSYVQLTEMDSCPSDDKAAELAAKQVSDDFSGIGYETRPQYVSKKEKLAEGIFALEARAAGMHSGHENSAPEVFTSVTVLWVKEKRCFLLSSKYEMDAMHDHLALRKTLKAAP